MQLNERGFTTTYALILMTVLIILGAGLLPAANNMLKMTMIDRNAEIAQAAAESGVKRVISELYNADKNTKLPDWVGKKNAQIVIKGKNNVNFYLENPINDTGSLYKCTVVGTCADAIRKVYVEIEHTSKNNSKLVDFTDYKILAFSPKKINSGAVTDGGKIFSYMNDGIEINFLNIDTGDSVDSYITTNGRYYQQGLLFPKHYYSRTPSYWQIPTPVVMNKLELVDPEFFKGYRNLTEEYMKNSDYGYEEKDGKKTFTPKKNIGLYTDPGVYELDGSLTLEGSILDIRHLKIWDPGSVILHIKGDLEVNSFSRIGFFLQNSLKSYDALKYMLIIVDGNVTVRSQAGINFATIICYGKINVGNNVNIFGSIQGKEGIDISQGGFDLTPVNLFYKETGVKPFRGILQQINTPDIADMTTFKIKKWQNIK